jgi:hypothetical protein
VGKEGYYGDICERPVNRNQINVEDQQSDAKGQRTNGEDAQPNEHLLKEREHWIRWDQTSLETSMKDNGIRYEKIVSDGCVDRR